MDWLNPSTFSVSPWVAPGNPWATPASPEPAYRPDFADDEALKQAYGIALGKGLKAFDAGMELFNQELPKALWASLNWVGDPVVIAACDSYKQTLSKLQKPLDKEQLLAKILAFYEATADEPKEQLNSLKLYAEVSGFIGKVDINASTNISNTTNNNLMKITLVKAEHKDAPRDIAPNIKSKIQNEEMPLIPLKLVGGTSR